MDEEKMRQIAREEFAKIFHSEKYHFSRDVQLANGRNIELGTSVGTMLGTATTQKLGLYGVSPVAKQAAIVMPNVQTGVYVQADAETLRSAITDLYNRIQTFGICS